MDALRWLRTRGCSWDGLTPAKAAEGSELATLRYVHVMGCPWSELTCAAAAGTGAWNCLLYARSNGCPWDARTTAWVVEGGHLDIYRWAVSLGCEASDAVHAKAERLGSSRPNAMAAMTTKLHAWSLMGIAVR